MQQVSIAPNKKTGQAQQTKLYICRKLKRHDSLQIYRTCMHLHNRAGTLATYVIFCTYYGKAQLLYMVLMKPVTLFSLLKSTKLISVSWRSLATLCILSVRQRFTVYSLFQSIRNFHWESDYKETSECIQYSQLATMLNVSFMLAVLVSDISSFGVCLYSLLIFSPENCLLLIFYFLPSPGVCFHSFSVT